MNTEIILNNNNYQPETVIDALKNVFDPEISYSIYDLGLIYKIEINENKINVLMTLTSANCPEAEAIPQDAKEMIANLCPGAEIEINITFEPQWTLDNLPEEIQLKMGLL